MFKEAGLRSPRTQLTKFQIEISVRGQRTEANGRGKGRMHNSYCEMFIIGCNLTIFPV